MPNIKDVIGYMSFLGLLSTPTKDELGSFERTYWSNPEVIAISNKFQEQLKAIDQEIARRNESRKRPYQWLELDKVANSIQI